MSDLLSFADYCHPNFTDQDLDGFVLFFGDNAFRKLVSNRNSQIYRSCVAARDRLHVDNLRHVDGYGSFASDVSYFNKHAEPIWFDPEQSYVPAAPADRKAQPGVVVNFGLSAGTGAGRRAQDRIELEIFG